ncbi:thiolase family protein (plasmid) [Pseudonocardia bannensis]|uniref:propanoyl-CoA C-acyltransferase n=1 Tax=Pseudonocardia bannensis TaxID=630973 RepID=A0A848DSH6_9PSEU|nr:thiolase family protein [Pseudonocardia bannensis]NMH95475.1 thiolase family protein [Pseudonocardia bannensis]
MDAAIVGTGITRFGMFVGTRLRKLASCAADRALDDAGLDAADVDLVVVGNAAAGLLTGQEMIRAHTALADSRVAGRPMLSVENACASSSSAVHLGILAVASGAHDTVLVVGAEKMTSADRTLAGRTLATAVDLEREGQVAPDGAARPVFMEIYAAEARAYMQRSGATPRDLAAVAAKSSHNGSLNPIAQVRDPLTVDEVLAARTIVDPLTRPMCSSIGDGAAALVLTRPELARRRGQQAVRVLASTVGAARAGDAGDVVARTARRAYEQAGLGPADVDVCEVHDAAAPAELLIAEELGLVPAGGAVALARDGAFTLGGRCPINPSGGLVARGHPIGATGAAQIVELADQLRARAGGRQVEGAGTALAENAGGSLGNGPAACVVTLLAAP